MDERTELDAHLEIVDHMRLTAYIETSQNLEHNDAKEFFRMLLAAEDEQFTDLGSLDAYVEATQTVFLSPDDRWWIERYLTINQFLENHKNWAEEEYEQT